MRYKTMFTTLILGAATLLGAQIPKESLLILSDRGHYISGETIRFRAFHLNPTENIDVEWSRVLYIELIMPNGTSLVQNKVKIDSSGAYGELAIPEGLSSGTYFLKAYTHWMRNCGPDGFIYTSLQIYDPYNEQVLPHDTSGCKPGKIEGFLHPKGEETPGELECRLERETFQTREEVKAELKWNFPNGGADFTVSVAKAGLHDKQEYFGSPCPVSSPEDFQFLPENQGISLTGQVVSSVDGTPAPYASIYLTVLGSDKDFFCNFSDSAGYFYFSFPGYYGEKELFVSTYHREIDDLELLIDRDFSKDALQLPSPQFQLNESFTQTITEMSVNAQVHQQYYPSKASDPEEDTTLQRLFYGSPLKTIYFDDYIHLPNLEEYFIEVVPQISVKRHRGVRRLVVLGEHPDLEIYPPLVMIDGVAISDLEAVLAVSPRLIHRLEIVNAPYIRGNITFGGIVSLISRNNDLGYIDLPSSGLLVNYRMLNQPLCDSVQNGVFDPRLPDLRNTLYWNPHLELGSDKNREISFRTSDLKGEYEMLIRGTDSSGRFLTKRVLFTVE